MKRRKRRNTDHFQTIVKSNGKPQTFAVDWMGGNIFWIEANPSRYTINVKPLFRDGRRVLFHIEPFDKPNHLVLYPEKR